jgi:hypothetical protein
MQPQEDLLQSPGHKIQYFGSGLVLSDNKIELSEVKE